MGIRRFNLKTICVSATVSVLLFHIFITVISSDIQGVEGSNEEAIVEDELKEEKMESLLDRDDMNEVSMEDGRRFKLFEKKRLQHKKANSFCKKREGQLVRASNVEEMRRLQMLLMRARMIGDQLWVGADKKMWKKHSMKMMGKERPNLGPDVQMFGGGGPTEMCPALSTSTRSMIPAPCHHQLPFICEFGPGKGKKIKKPEGNKAKETKTKPKKKSVKMKDEMRRKREIQNPSSPRLETNSTADADDKDPFNSTSTTTSVLDSDNQDKLIPTSPLSSPSYTEEDFISSHKIGFLPHVIALSKSQSITELPEMSTTNDFNNHGESPTKKKRVTALADIHLKFSTKLILQTEETLQDPDQQLLNLINEQSRNVMEDTQNTTEGLEKLTTGMSEKMNLDINENSIVLASTTESDSGHEHRTEQDASAPTTISGISVSTGSPLIDILLRRETRRLPTSSLHEKTTFLPGVSHSAGTSELADDSTTETGATTTAFTSAVVLKAEAGKRSPNPSTSFTSSEPSGLLGSTHPSKLNKKLTRTTRDVSSTETDVESRSIPEPTTAEAEHIPKGKPGPSSDPASNARPNPALPDSGLISPASEPESEPSPTSKPSPNSAVSEPESEPSKKNPSPEPESEPGPISPSSEPESEPRPNSPLSEPSKNYPTSEPESEPGLISPASEPESEPRPNSPLSEPGKNYPTSEPESEPGSISPASEPESEPRPNSPLSELSSKPPAPEPESEPGSISPSSEPEPESESRPNSPLSESNSKPPAPEPESEPGSISPSSEPEPESRPNSPLSESNSKPPAPEPESEPGSIAPSSEPESEPGQVYPSTEPGSEPHPNSPKPEPTGVPEGTPELNVTPDSTSSRITAYPKGTTESPRMQDSTTERISNKVTAPSMKTTSESNTATAPKTTIDPMTRPMPPMPSPTTEKSNPHSSLDRNTSYSDHGKLIPTKNNAGTTDMPRRESAHNSTSNNSLLHPSGTLATVKIAGSSSSVSSPTNNPSALLTRVKSTMQTNGSKQNMAGTNQNTSSGDLGTIKASIPTLLKPQNSTKSPDGKPSRLTIVK